MPRTAPLYKISSIQTLGIKVLCLQLRPNGKKGYMGFSLWVVDMAGRNGRNGLPTAREAMKRYPKIHPNE